MGLQNPGMSTLDLDAVLGSLHQSRTSLDTINRDQAGSATTAVDGTAYWTYFTPLVDMLVTKMSFWSSTAATAGATLIRFGIGTAAANGDITLVAQTASDTTIFAAASTEYERNLEAAYQLRKGTRYAAGFIIVGGAPGNVRASASLTTAAGKAPRVVGLKAGQADLANVAGLANSANPFLANIAV